MFPWAQARARTRLKANWITRLHYGLVWKWNVELCPGLGRSLQNLNPRVQRTLEYGQTVLRLSDAMVYHLHLTLWLWFCLIFLSNSKDGISTVRNRVSYLQKILSANMFSSKNRGSQYLLSVMLEIEWFLCEIWVLLYYPGYPRGFPTFTAVPNDLQRNLFHILGYSWVLSRHLLLFTLVDPKGNGHEIKRAKESSGDKKWMLERPGCVIVEVCHWRTGPHALHLFVIIF